MVYVTIFYVVRFRQKWKKRPLKYFYRFVWAQRPLVSSTYSSIRKLIETQKSEYWADRFYEGEFKWKFKNLPVQKLSACWENKACQMKPTFKRKRKCIHKVSWICNRFFTNEDIREQILQTPGKVFRHILQKHSKTFSNLF